MSKLFDSGFFLIMILLIVVMLVQYHLTYKQVTYMNKVARRYARDGYVFAVGRTKRWLQTIHLLVVADYNGEIHNSEILDGITVFARYKPFPQFNGMKIEEILLPAQKTEFRSKLDKSIDKALRSACQQIRDYLIDQKGKKQRLEAIE
jgi:DNA-binding transcriptional regulator of glucitol operon